MAEAAAVLDVGKTHAKLSLVGADGALLAVRSRANATPVVDGRRALDTDGIEAWAMATLGELAGLAEIVAIVPVGHGAAAALIDGDRLAAPVLDYEAEPPADTAAAYDGERDPYEATLSPRLGQGLNLGLQLFWQESLYPDLWPDQARALLWPQYWAWRLCGEMASEVSSLGCHSDLWRPYEAGYSDLAKRRGWDERLGPIVPAGAVLGEARPGWGLPKGCRVLCGLHDSNASLHATRGFPEIAGRPFSLISTGTWFVTFQSGGAGPKAYDPTRDMLANVDIEGRPVPSARFMGGRDFAATGGGVEAALDLARKSVGDLDLVGAEGPIVVEGRFADDPVYPAALAALRLGTEVYACPTGDAVAIGAARLVWPALPPSAPLRRIYPASLDSAAAQSLKSASTKVPVR